MASTWRAPGVAFDLGCLAHIAVHHDQPTLAAKPTGDVFHGKPCRLLVARADQRRGDGLSLGIHVHDRDLRRQRFIHGRRAGLDFAGVEDNDVYPPWAMKLSICWTCFSGLRWAVVDDQRGAEFPGPLLHRLVDHDDELGR